MPEIPVEVHEEAIAEARAAREWYESRSPAAAIRFFEELERAVEQIAKFPEAWSPHLTGTRRYLLRRFPYAVVYRQRERDIQIVAVAHHKRKPGYRKSRIKTCLDCDLKPIRLRCPGGGIKWLR